MALLRHGVLQPDAWTFIGDDTEVPDTGAIIVTFGRWLRDRTSLTERADAVGVRLKNDQSVREVSSKLNEVPLIELEFPKFTDGRAYSQARQLRDNFGYRGEIRAFGSILRDQFLFMKRCGIDSVVLPEGAKIDGYLEALGEFSVWYQPASDERMPVIALRHRPTYRTGVGSAALISANVAAQRA